SSVMGTMPMLWIIGDWAGFPPCANARVATKMTSAPASRYGTTLNDLVFILVKVYAFPARMAPLDSYCNNLQQRQVIEGKVQEDYRKHTQRKAGVHAIRQQGSESFEQVDNEVEPETGKEGYQDHGGAAPEVAQAESQR